MKNDKLYFSKLTNIAIVFTFFSLWIAIFFSDQVENALAYVLILTFGMLHGANDLKLIQKSTRNETNRKAFLTTLVFYLTVVFVGFGLFYLLPALAFILFIVVSGYHFGEQHWVSKLAKKGFLGRFFCLVYGLFILAMLFSIHPDTVFTVVYKITGYQVAPILYTWAAWISGGLVGLSYLVLYLQRRVAANLVKQLFFLLVFYIVFNTASLLWSFAIYFILWHSLPSIADQVVFLYGNLTKSSFLKYAKSSFIYWLVAAMGSSCLLFVLRNDMETSLSFFLSFLGAITFPHVFVISRLNHD